jgi:hypothetical protein
MSLGSASNYILSNQCNHITGLVVTIDVTQDLVLKSSTNSEDNHGFSFQLNCYSPPGFDDAWQQYIFALFDPVFPNSGPAALNAWIDNWPAKGNNLIDEIDFLIGTRGTTIPAGYQLQIRLLNDNQDNVVGAHWIVNYIGVLPAPTTPLTGYVTVDNAGNTEPHLNYIGIDGHIHERPATLPRYDNDLSVLAGSSIFPAPNSALDAYADLDGGQHVNFIGTDSHVHELYLASGGHWIDNDLTQLAQLSGDSVPPMSGSPLDGYVDNDRAQHVNFIGTDGHVHELLIKPNGHWIDNDLIVKSGNGITPRFNSPLDGYVDNDNGQHVNFIGTDGHVHELYIKPKGQWINNDLIVLSGNGIAPSRTSSLCGYMAQDNGQHVNFIGTDGHVHELYNLHSAQWLNNDLTQLAQLSGPSVPPAHNSALCGWWVLNGRQHVNFIGTDGHVHDLSIAAHGQWADSDLTHLSGTSATPAANGALSSCGTAHDELFVNYVDVNFGHLHQLLIVSLTQCIDSDLNNIQLADFLKSPIGLPASQIAPINAFQLNLVGPGSAGNAVFSSGAGTFTYTASAPLTAQNKFPSPSCTGVTWGTGETSNSVYGTLDAGPSSVITQTFSIDPTESIIHFQGPLAPGLKIPRKRGGTPQTTSSAGNPGIKLLRPPLRRQATS